MELEYNLDNQDIVNFNIFHFTNSPLIRKQTILVRFGISTLYILIGALFSYIEKSYFFIIVFLILSVTWFLFYKKYLLNKTRKNVSKMLQEDKNKGMIGKQKIIIESNKIFEITDYSIIEHNNKFLNKIVNDEKYYFLYLTSISAQVIPKTAFKDENQEKEFVKKIQQFVE
jgi:YcxB-like protein